MENCPTSTFSWPPEMAKVSLLNFQYNVAKWPVRWGTRDKQVSGLSPSFQPNEAEMKQVFDKFDANKDGKISKEEYRSVLVALGKQNLDIQVKEVFQVADSDGDGYISFKDLMGVHERSGGVKKLDIRNAFSVFDLDRDGKISAEELLEVFARLGESCSLEFCKKMVKAVDADEDGLIGMEDFMKMMTQTMRMY